MEKVIDKIAELGYSPLVQEYIKAQTFTVKLINAFLLMILIGLGLVLTVMLLGYIFLKSRR